MSTRRLQSAVILASILLVGVAAFAQDTTATMRNLFGALVTLMPYTLEESDFSSPENRADIERALDILAGNASVVESHGLGLNQSYAYAREILAEDARAAHGAFDDGAMASARHIVRNITENCFACHSRLPAGEREELSTRFASAIAIDRVPIEDRVKLLVATRQFHAAIDMAEKILTDPELEPAHIDFMGTIEDYLKVSVRVVRDLDRPRMTLWKFVQRDDLPVYLDLQVSEWVDSLEELRGLEIEDELSQARELLEEGRRLGLYMQDRRGLVHATIASALLHQFVATAPEDIDDLAEAYYLLGLAETTISRTIWIPETEFFLEMAVRAAPGSETAGAAYVLMEQFVIANYTGSAGTLVPDDVWERLMELRDLAGVGARR